MCSDKHPQIHMDIHQQTTTTYDSLIKPSLLTLDKFQLLTLVIPFDSSCMLLIGHQLPSVSAPADLCTFELKYKTQKHIHVRFASYTWSYPEQF